jgi:4-amino-4-deoxy-L-arabinose transferase-like glycosyltransferase
MTENVAAPTIVPPSTVLDPVSRTRRVGEWTNRHASTIALVAVGLSLVIAGGYSLVLGNQIRYFDEQVYVQLARSLAHGHGFSFDNVQPTAYRPPGYPFILLPVYLLTGGSVLAMRFIGVLSLMGTVWMVFLLGRRAHSPATGALAALVVACYPLLIYTATTLYPQVPALFLLLAMVELGLRAMPGDGRFTGRRGYQAVVAGLLGGLLTTAVPTFGVTVVVLVGWLVWRQWQVARRIAVRTVVALLVATALLPVAWCVRNAVELHAFVPVSTNNGINLLLGNSTGATPDGGRVENISTYENAAAGMHLDEVQIDHYYAAQSIDWIRDNPGHAAVLFVQKVGNNFAYHNELATAGRNSTGQDIVSALTFYPILLLALLRVVFLRRWPLHPTEKLVLGMLVLNVLLLAAFYTRLRFRVPLDGLTIVLAASTVGHWLLGRRAGSAAEPAVGSGARPPVESPVESHAVLVADQQSV